MANTIVLGQVTDAAVATLHERLGITNLVYRDFSNDIVTAKRGDTMNVRKPTTFVAKDFDHATGIEIQDINEGSVPVVLDKIADVSFSLTDTELTLEVDEFRERFIVPAMNAIAQKIDRDMITAMLAAAGDEVEGAEDHKSLIQAGLALNTKNVPLDRRYAVIDPYLEASWREADSIQHADKSGSTEALRQGSVGQNLHGFDVFWTQNMNTASSEQNVGVAFHRDAFTFTNAALYIPASADAAVSAFNGLTLRAVQGYDVHTKKTVFSVDCLYGISTLDANKAVSLVGGDAGNP